MAVQVKAGKILRRGTDGLSPAQLKELLDNPDKVQAIIDDIEARRAVFLETEAATKARLAELEKTEADLSDRADAVVRARTALEEDTKAAAVLHRGDMDALGRRTREVIAKEGASVERTAALDVREGEIEAMGLKQENELRGRQEAIESAEAAAEVRDEALQKLTGELERRRTRIETAAKMVKQAVVPLG